jgi:hypothetical protein
MVERGVANAVERIRELLYREFNREGGWADVLIPGGWLENDPDGIAEAREERTRFYQMFKADLEPVIRAVPATPHARVLREFLADLAVDAATRPDPYDPEYRPFLLSLRNSGSGMEVSGQISLPLEPDL